MKNISKAFFLFVLFSVVFFASLTSCGNSKTQKGNEGQEFKVAVLRVWNTDVLQRDVITPNVDEEISKNIDIKVLNCKTFKVDCSIGDKNASTVGSEGAALVDFPEFPNGTNELTITLKAEGMKTFVKKLRVGIGLEDTTAKVFLKLDDSSDDSSLIRVDDNSERFTKKDTAKVVIKSEGVMTKVLVNKVNVPISEDKKSAEAPVTVGKVEISIEYAEFNAFLFNFKLTKLPENEKLPVMLNTATLYSGEGYQSKNELDFTVKNEKNENEMKDAVGLADIQYSVVKLVMTFDSPLEKVEFVRFQDGRSGEYESKPVETDLAGIFSGRIVKEIDASGKEKELKNIDGNTYTEYLVVGAGKVDYTIKFTAKDRKEQTYKIKINNVMERKFFEVDAEKNGKFTKFMNGLTYYGLYARNNIFRWTGYTKQPWDLTAYKGSYQDWWASMQQPEYMGDNIDITLSTNADIQGKLYFCYNISQNLRASKCHEWVRMELEEKIEKVEGQDYKCIHPIIDPKESYLDAFVGVKDSLPWISMPVSTDKKWKKILDKGFILKIARSEIVKKMRMSNKKLEEYDKEADKIFEEVFNYRIQAKTYEKNNNAEGLRKSPLVVAMKQTWVQTTDLAEVKFKPEAYLITGDNSSSSKRDIFAMVPTFSGDMGESVKSFKYTIAKEGSTDPKDKKEYTYTDVAGMTSFVIGGEKGCTYTQRQGDTPPAVTGHDKIFQFEKGAENNENVYKVEVEVELKTGKKEYFNFVIDYKNEHKLEQM